jgi:hypothetical protein
MGKEAAYTPFGENKSVSITPLELVTYERIVEESDWDENP